MNMLGSNLTRNHLQLICYTTYFLHGALFLFCFGSTQCLKFPKHQACFATGADPMATMWRLLGARLVADLSIEPADSCVAKEVLLVLPCESGAPDPEHNLRTNRGLPAFGNILSPPAEAQHCYRG